MGQQASRCLCHAVNPEHLSACALGLGRPGQESELVTNFDTRGQTELQDALHNFNIRTPQGVLDKDLLRDLPQGKLDRTVRRRLFEEDQALSLWAQRDGAVHEPLLPSIGVAREGVRPYPLAIRLGFVSPEPAVGQPPARCCVSPEGGAGRSPQLGASSSWSPTLMQALGKTSPLRNAYPSSPVKLLQAHSLNFASAARAGGA